MLDLIKSNEEIISQLKGKIKQGEKKYYSFMAAINALDINNDMCRYIVSTFEGESKSGEAIQRLYAILQSLFVSIDALYTLNIVLTNNKNFININQNRQLRELKYIRNDVVGHPSNRVYEGEGSGCCILKKDLVTKKSFKYYIYFNKEIKAREIRIPELIMAYYEEANRFLSRISLFNPFDSKVILEQIKKIYRKLNSDLDIQEDIFELRGMYLKNNAATSKNDVRFIWRVELLLKLKKTITSNDKDLTEAIDYAAGYQIMKLYESMMSFSSVADKEGIGNAKKMPKGIQQFVKMIEKNPNLVELCSILHDMTHPLFAGALTTCIEVASNTGNTQAKRYLEIMKSFHEQKDSDMIYCLGIVLKNAIK